MKASSAKAKGRRAAAELAALILKAFPDLTEDDLRITPAGVTGSDIMLSQQAKKSFPFSIECKNVERLNIWAALEQAEKHDSKEKEVVGSIVAFKRNRQGLKIALDAKLFLGLVSGELLR
jgi:hypothetical protein